MVARIWRTGVKPERFKEYERFARERSLPMFREQRGVIGVLLMRERAVRAAVLTLWEDEGAVEKREASPLYSQTFEVILGSGFLPREQSVWRSSRCKAARSWQANSRRDSGVKAVVNEIGPPLRDLLSQA